ncbi:MAG: universal stress protein [Mesorhizobium sp.]|nr:universal stress protein [Mesorhizobium sp.]MBN9244637.1 universal stress protein [Mesorhizobium sp.]
MYTHFLLPTDGSELAQAGVKHGLSLARQYGARVTAVMATEAPGGQFAYSSDLWTPGKAEMAEYERDQHREAEAILAPVKANAEQLGLEIETVHVPDRRAAPAILDTAHKCGCDVIVMASHGRTGMSRVMLGSHTAEVLARADIPVIVFR